MQEAIARMLARYERRNLEDTLRALREVLQEIALLGLWRGKFFDRAAFYGGTALRILHGLDRFSEDLDFSLLEPDREFDLGGYATFLQDELKAYGVEARVETRTKGVSTAIQSAFLKADTRQHPLMIETPRALVETVPRNQLLKVRLEVDTDPPPGFVTQTRYLLQPIPFSLRAHALPDLFAGKMHAVLCREWKRRIKGRDWYDFIWFVAHYPLLHLAHLEQRMRQTGHWSGETPLGSTVFLAMLNEAIERLDVDQAREEVRPFARDTRPLEIWSREFFHNVANRIQFE